MADGQSTPAGGVGSVAFDVADRLAIINLFGAYAYTYGENRLDEFRALFTESPQLVMLYDGAELSQDIDTVMMAVQPMGRVDRPDTSPRHRVNAISKHVASLDNPGVRSAVPPRGPQRPRRRWE
jgi:hypothetical protein